MTAQVGIVGWRGMVGSVLMQRMIAEGDFEYCIPTFFSTSQAGADAPAIGKKINNKKCLSANDLPALAKMDVLISCQGGDYTNKIHPELRESGWNGYWIDAASSLRMADNATIVLDPVNRDVIDMSLKNGIKDYAGGNCTVSLMLMALTGLIRTGQVEWISAMTYQAASGGGAAHMRELLQQMGDINSNVSKLLSDNKSSILEIDNKVHDLLRNKKLHTEHFGHSLAANLLPWIDSELPNGQSREEWKAQTEANKILKCSSTLPIDGLCVRVGSLRSHAQALTIKMKKPMGLEKAREHIEGAHQWLKFVPNHKEESLEKLSPAAVSGTRDIAIGRLRKLSIGEEYLTCFTVGDQLLWGAAEPLRRMLRIILNK